MSNKTISYYNENARAFFKRTVSADVSEFYKLFLDHLPNQPTLLDLGCGSGRDSKYFLNQGFKVVSCDASQEMVRLASDYTKQDVLCLKFEDMEFGQKFDGVWANASLLHVPYNELNSVIEKIHTALKPDGILYASFKHGNCHRVDTKNRGFYDMNEEMIGPYIDPFFETLKIIISEDTRSQVAASPSKQWFNILAKKK